MTNLYEWLRAKNPAGIPYSDAIQLFLWLYCTTDFLPLNLKTEPLGRKELVETFSQLEVEQVIISRVAFLEDEIRASWNAFYRKVFDERDRARPALP
jgi:hypothetical protein